MKAFSPVFIVVLCILVSGGNCRSLRAKTMKRQIASTNDLEMPEPMPEPIPNPADEMAEASENLLEKGAPMPKPYMPDQVTDVKPGQVFDELVEHPQGVEKVEGYPNGGEKAWANEFDDDLHFECPRKGAIHKVESEHSWTREDRRWLFECADVVQQASTLTCAWTKDAEVNEFDHPFYYECPANHYLAGVSSIHSHKKEDRQWRYKCCGGKMLSTESCVLSEFVNWFGGSLAYSAPEGHVMVGAGSINKNRMEDRIWKFSTCQYTSK